MAVAATAYEDSDGIQITAYATNKGERDTNVNIGLFGDAGMVNQIASHNGVSIAVGETAGVKFVVKPDAVEYNESGNAYLAVCANVSDGDYNMSDNVAYIALYEGEKVEVDTSPKETNSPDATEKPSTTEKPNTTEKPIVTEKPHSTGHPNAAVTPVVIDTPNVSEVPDTSAHIVLKDKTGLYTIIRDGVLKPEVSYTAPKNKKVTSVIVPDKVTIDGTSYIVTSINAKAF